MEELKRRQDETDEQNAARMWLICPRRLCGWMPMRSMISLASIPSFSTRRFIRSTPYQYYNAMWILIRSPFGSWTSAQHALSRLTHAQAYC